MLIAFLGKTTKFFGPLIPQNFALRKLAKSDLLEVSERLQTFQILWN